MTDAPPIPVIPLDYAKPSTLSRQRQRWAGAAQVVLVLAAADALGGWLLIAFVDTESSVITGACLFALGLLLLIASSCAKLLLSAILAIAHCSICLLFTMLVNVLSWSPGEATKPFTIMAGVYLFAVVLPVSAVAFVRLRAIKAAAATFVRDLPSTGEVAEDKP